MKWALQTGLLWLALVMTTTAVVFEFTGDPNFNTSAPTGPLTNSGWQYQGRWDVPQPNGGFYLGTPIAPRYFITAKHVLGTTNETFVWNGFTYHPVWFTNCPSADLRVWRVTETFPRYAPLYTKTNEVGQPCVVFGRGRDRAEPVVVDGETNGWRCGVESRIQRWGENVVAGTAAGGPSYGSLLACTFDRGVGSNECHLSVGDSSGAMFIQDGGTWKLAGIHLAVDGPFNTTNSDTGSFDATLLDKGGLWEKDGSWRYYTNTVSDLPSAFYSTRIAANTAWIQSVIDFLPGNDLRLTEIAVAGNDVRVSFQSFTNRLYRLERCDDLVAGNWAPWTNNIPGTNGPITLTDTNAVLSPRRFYRLGLDR